MTGVTAVGTGANYGEDMAAPAFEQTESALRERVKELTCLYGIARITQVPEMPLREALQAIVELLPPAWQYPERASARIIVDANTHTTPNYQEYGDRQTAEVAVGGRARGAVEVVYSPRVPSLPSSPFLKEEQKLLEMVAKEVATLLERSETAERNFRLQDQLRHADRLATIGQLAAGVAHEINEPLANILGFAQLARKTPELPPRAMGDLDKIVNNCLHAREVMRKLLTFARQVPPETSRVSLNLIVKDGLYFVESRCAKAGIEVVRSLDPELPEIEADASQLHQVLVNLVVNAVQAMPNGGRLTISTQARADHVALIVQDTGVGMTAEVKRNIFAPFFTTKDVNQGTGLGLPVVHGIVSSHGGTVDVESEPGRGARFEIRLPLEGRMASG